MKWHRNLYEGTIQALEEIISTRKPVDQVLKQLFHQNRKWGKRDREFIQKTIFEIIRRKNLWEKLAEKLFQSTQSEKILTVYILITADTPPDYLSVYFPKIPVARKIYNQLIKNNTFKLGYPAWLLDEFKYSFPDQTETILSELNHTNHPVIRVNTLKINRNDFAEILNKKQYEFYLPENYPEAIVFKKPYRLTSTGWYRMGWFEIQDLSSQHVSYFSGVKPGMKVIDTCAGAGGKTLHMAALMKNQGQIVAMDINSAKLDELARRARRAGIKILQIEYNITTGTIQKLENSADIVLIDAPCSGTGTFKRKPQLKWTLHPDIFNRIIQNQQNILSHYAYMTKPGKYLIYVTCSLLKKENQNQIKNFLLKHKDFTFVEEKYILPSEGHDGFYMAKLKRR